ncbi:subtilisin-like protein protease SBT3.5 [Cinnamomum micranthum f. kanehirae]|uniref:Subtilisin-like protein protease SBT3.5 n=1 Tax=Cinnamomum micranthum f. kanehirae TaxID=337451 RepID=A0A3S3P7U8_9MAGN|nr:subtilisin-like protein protease SBT3.5 [Cinnamomum micranthum f. kanehirae]
MKDSRKRLEFKHCCEIKPFFSNLRKIRKELNIVASSKFQNMQSSSKFRETGEMGSTLLQAPKIPRLARKFEPKANGRKINWLGTTFLLDPSGEPILTIEDAQKIAGPFDFGGGIVNPNRAADPGLIYKMGMTDYVHYLCSIGYNNSAISTLTLHPSVCPHKNPSVLNRNLLSMTVPNLRASVTITRTVTNVGPIDNTYDASVKRPLGIQVAVRPHMLVFNSTVMKLSFTVILSSSHKTIGGYYIGSLSWSDGIRKVTSPISVKTEIIPSYIDLS